MAGDRREGLPVEAISHGGGSGVTPAGASSGNTASYRRRIRIMLAADPAHLAGRIPAWLVA
jgi:hypothetical protein